MVLSMRGLLSLVRPISTTRIGPKAHSSYFSACLIKISTCHFNGSHNREVIVRETWIANHQELKHFFKIAHVPPTNVEGREPC